MQLINGEFAPLQRRNIMKLNTRDIVTIGLLSTILLIGKYVFDFIPNVEVVSLLLMMFAITYGLKSVYG